MPHTCHKLEPSISSDMLNDDEWGVKSNQYCSGPTIVAVHCPTAPSHTRVLAGQIVQLALLVDKAANNCNVHSGVNTITYSVDSFFIFERVRCLTTRGLFKSSLISDLCNFHCRPNIFLILSLSISLSLSVCIGYRSDKQIAGCLEDGKLKTAHQTTLDDFGCVEIA